MYALDTYYTALLELNYVFPLVLVAPTRKYECSRSRNDNALQIVPAC